MSLKKLIAFVWVLSAQPFVYASGMGACNPNDFIRSALLQPELKLNFTPHELELESMGKKIIKDLQKGKEYTYYVDTFDQVHFTEGNHLYDEAGDFFAVRNIGSKDAFVIKESGFLNFNPEAKSFDFKSKRGWDLAPGEADQYLKKLELEEGVRFTRSSNPALEKARVIKCLDVMSSRNKGKNFIMDTIVSSNVVSIAGVVTNELAGNHLLSTEEGRRLVAADFIGNNISTLITGPIVKKAIMTNVHWAPDLAIRTALDFGTNKLIKANLYNALQTDQQRKEAEEKKKTLGDKLVPYDTGFGVARFFPKRMLDRALVYKIPQMMVDSCLKGSPVSAIVGPRMIRIADRYTWGLVYLAGRKVYLDTIDKK